MDPQQRLLLECMAEVLAQDPAAASTAPQQQYMSGGDVGSATHHHAHSQGMGVYVGVSQLEYARICLEQGTPLTPYYATGG
jgi:acyl transferase domain-containing protein